MCNDRLVWFCFGDLSFRATAKEVGNYEQKMICLDRLLVCEMICLLSLPGFSVTCNNVNLMFTHC